MQNCISKCKVRLNASFAAIIFFKTKNIIKENLVVQMKSYLNIL